MLSSNITIRRISSIGSLLWYKKIVEIVVDPQKFQECHQFLCIITLILIEICNIALYFLPGHYTLTVRMLMLICCSILIVRILMLMRCTAWWYTTTCKYRNKTLNQFAPLWRLGVKRVRLNLPAEKKVIAENRNHTTETNRFKGNQEFLTLILKPRIAFLCGSSQFYD